MDHIVSGVGVLDKSLALVRILEHEPMTLADLVAASGFSRATTHRLVSALVDQDLVRRDEHGRYDLGWGLVGLGAAAQRRLPLARVARPILLALRDRSGESTQLYVVDAGERVCVSAFDSPDELRTVVAVGSRLPLDRGSAGAALRGLVGDEGWVASVGERAPGVASVSAPVVLGDGTIVAALGVSGPLDRLGGQPGSTHGRAVADAAAELSLVLSA